MKNIEEATGMLGHVIETYARAINKQLKQMKRF
jgi:hypothetical protein